MSYFCEGRKYRKAPGLWILREAPPPERRGKAAKKVLPVEQCGRRIPGVLETRQRLLAMGAERSGGGLAPAALKALIDRGLGGLKNRPPPRKEPLATLQTARDGPQSESRDMLKQRRLRELAVWTGKERLAGAEQTAQAVQTFEARQNETRAERIARLKAGLKQLE